MDTFKLPPAIEELIRARNSVRTHYRRVLENQNSEAVLKFTLDGNLVGDLGEAVAVELFGIKLVAAKSHEGFDGISPDGKFSVQVKATGTGRGPAFRNTSVRADKLLFFDFDFERSIGKVLFNGPEDIPYSMLPDEFIGQRQVSRSQIIKANTLVDDEDRLRRI